VIKVKVISPQQSRRDTRKIAKVVIVNDKGEILLLLRRKDQPFPMKWDLPGGHLKEGETWEEGARREAKEETNLDIRKMKMISDKGKNKYFKTEDWGGEIFSSKELPEHDDFLWVDPNTLADLDIGKIYLAVIKSAFK